MASVLDVAAYIVHREGEMTATKLQKLVYYCQAWHLVWEDTPLFTARIEAWANGPVSPTLYRTHRLQYEVRSVVGGNYGHLKPNERESIDLVLDTYGKLSGYDLSVRTHKEPPWLEARRGLAPGERANTVISHRAMAEYYGSLT